MSEQRPAGASSRCPHSDMAFNLNVASFGDTNIRYLEIKANCKICGELLRFRGQIGMGPDMPRVNPDGSELRVPFMVGDEDYDGQATGFSVKVVSA